MRCVRTSEGCNEIRIDGLGKRTCMLYMYKPIGVKSNITQLFRRSREAEFRSCYWSLVRMAPQSMCKQIPTVAAMLLEHYN